MEKLRGLGHLFGTVFLYGMASFMVVPAITDVTMSALCPGKDECSLAIYLSGIQQAIVGFGTVILTPLIGNLSDEYGRKALLTIPMTASVIPLVILAYSRETKFFYAYFVLRTLAAMVGEGTINCLALAYVADNVPGTERVSAFGILSGVLSAAFVCGTLAARFISTALTFQVAAVASMVAVVYMRIFLKDSMPVADESARLILKGSETDIDQNDGDSVKKIHVFKKIPSIGDLISLLRRSKIFAQAAVVAFFNNLAEGGLQASLLYFLKARFHFDKTQFADLMLIVGVAGTLSQLIFMPLLAPVLREERLLSIGLFAGFSHMFLYSIAWAPWVPYAITVFSIFAVFVSPCIRSIASKQVGPFEQGKAQGCLSGISSFANIVSPLIFSPLTALFLSEAAPFPYPGFSLMCIGLALMIGFVQSLMMKAAPPSTTKEVFGEEP
ncbi:tetracycline resistance protein, class D-like isoform X1 [Rhodamnia argentea]|uniref:Tetracycline resistance protein, class D-like isoform X1 n=1 Tax=Rhodamnia argentea TaxID=178133 RepID=A0A8B8NL59_9MYRT|nr:tetracycline resistance protein, class D-like isoform X1 [Rhodamnia argentea]XP_048128665.1 tetracycline resistance protein, class D-like isoform X1 [Rhodamnia argentea]